MDSQRILLFSLWWSMNVVSSRSGSAVSAGDYDAAAGVANFASSAVPLCWRCWSGRLVFGRTNDVPRRSGRFAAPMAGQGGIGEWRAIAG